MFKKTKILLLTLVVSAILLPSVSLATTLTSGWSMDNVSTFGLPGGTLTSIIGNILSWLLAIFGIVGIIGFIIAGLMYLLAAGDEDTIKTAKSAMKYSIIGVIVGLAGYVAIQAIAAMLGASYTI